MRIPIIETERLLLREYRDSTDFESYAEFYGSDLTKHYGGPLDRSAAWRAAAAMMGHWVIRGYGAWAVEEKINRRFLWDCRIMVSGRVAGARNNMGDS